MKRHNATLGIKGGIALVLTDLMAVILVLILPALSHLLPFPLYYLDPMRLVLFAAYFVNRNEWNAYALAIALPVFSMLYTGHPIPVKAMLISFELLLNMLVLSLLLNRGVSVFMAVLASIVLSKIAYYLAKWTLIQAAFLEGNLFSTSLITQLLIALGLSSVFYLFMGKKN